VFILRAVAATYVAVAMALSPLPAPSAAPSAPYTWKNVKVGGGGFIPGIVFSPIEKDLVYLRSDMGGAYRWNAPSGEWIPLHDQLRESSYFGTESVAPDPVDPNVVYLAVGMSGRDPAAMMRSADRGKTWDIYPVEFKMGGNENGRGVGERLAIDPNMTSILYFGSRHDGLQLSTDRAETWKPVDSFPQKGIPLPAGGGFGGFGGGGRGTGAGLSFVLFDPSSGTPDSPTPVIYVGSTDPGESHLFRTTDAGKTWEAVPGQPGKDLLPGHAALDAQGNLYVSYGNGVGPSNVTDGAVWKLNTHTGEWTDVTPDRSSDHPPGGYGGISVDRQRPGTLAVTTIDRFQPGDTVWRSTDGGVTWKDLIGHSEREAHETPFLYWGEDTPKLGWWMAAFAIDPFDSDHACYATGATIWATHDFTQLGSDQTTYWSPWVTGIEQTAIIALTSPTSGPHLISAFGDIGGFTHEDLAVSPPMQSNPIFNNTNSDDFAGQDPNVIIRAGTPHEGGPTLAYSEDAGKTWHPLSDPPQPPDPNAAATPPVAVRPRGGFGFGRGRSGVGLAVSADGKAIFATPRVAMITHDHGQTWKDVAGLPSGVRPIADRMNPNKLYALDFSNGSFYTSQDIGESFARSDSHGLPDTAPDTPRNREAMWPLEATLDQEGDLWYFSRTAGLFHSSDGGASFSRLESAPAITFLSFGKAPPGKTYPALFCLGTLNDLKAVWRSDDAGESWLRINDDQHQWGTRFRALAADPRIFGRVYVGTDGRGIFYGTPVSAEK
jgi:xyloglucan-specific exo-beta-1,4-glucanase